MIKKILGLFLISLCCVISLAFAKGDKPVQLAILTPVQLFPPEDSIKGLSLDLLYSVNNDVSGLTLGTGLAKANGDRKGISLGAINWTRGLSYGLKAGLLNYAGKNSVGIDAGVINIVQGDTKGVQLGIVNWNEGFFHGWQFGAVNEVNGPFVGLQCGLLNYAVEMSGLQLGFFNTAHSGAMAGVQCGFINYAAEMKGLQLGIFNTNSSLHGVQIGLANYNGNREPMVFMFLANWSF